MDNPIHPSAIGTAVAVVIAASTGSTLWWMLHPPASYVQKMAAKATSDVARLAGSIMVVFSAEIDSAHMMAFAAKIARGQKTELLALYVIEVPFTLPPNAEMPLEDRAALDALGSAESIAMNNGVDIRKETIKARVMDQTVLDVAKREKASLIMLGSFREGKYTGAPLGRTIERIAANAKCDVLIGVEGKHGTLLVDENALRSGS